MTDGKPKKRVKIHVNGERRDEADGPAEAADLSVADAVDVAFDDIMADARASRADAGQRAGDAKPGAPRGSADAKPGAAGRERDDASAKGRRGGVSKADGEAGIGPTPSAETVPAGDDPVAEVSAQRDEYLRHLQRLQAEFDNYRKRVQRDNESLTKRASEGVVESLLPVIDNMQRALAAAQEHEADALVEGVELVAGQFRAVLESHGLEDVVAEPGVPFDPTVHEAVLAQPHDELPEGTITQVLERGYLLHGRLLRPTKVIVAS